MVAGFKETDTAHEYITDGEFAIQKFDKRNSAGDDITPRFVAKHLCAQLGGSRLNSFFFDKTNRFVWPFGCVPRFAKKTVTFQPSVCKGAHFGHADHRLGRL